MGRLFVEYLEGSHLYACVRCGCHLSRKDDVVSKAFHGRHGKAYLFERACNVEPSIMEDRALMTGLHTVADLSCIRCHSYVGWFYVWAQESSQQYKIDKVILEKAQLKKVLWET